MSGLASDGPVAREARTLGARYIERPVHLGTLLLALAERPSTR